MTTPYQANFSTGSIVSSSALNNNFILLQNNMETYGDVSSQSAGYTSGVFTVADNFNPNTTSLIQVFYNGKKMRQGTVPIPHDYLVSGTNPGSIAFDASLLPLNNTYPVEIIYRKAV